MTLVGIIFIVAIVVIGIWMIFGFKKIKYKLLALLLIVLVLFSVFSFNSVFKGKDISIKNISDFGKITKIYFSWFGSVFANLKTISGQAIKMDWQGNNTS